MKQLGKNLRSILGIFVLGTISLWGVSLPENVPVKPVGEMLVAGFKNGLSLYQNQRPYYYNFFPFDDYLIHGDGKRTAFITQEEIKGNSYQAVLHQSHWQKIQKAVLSYFGLATPTAIFKGENKITYSVSVEGNKMTVNSVLAPQPKTGLQGVGRTISFYSSDFVFDFQGNLYTEKSEEDQAYLKQFYGIEPELMEGKFRYRVPGRSLIILNPNIAAVMIVRSVDPQELWVNQYTNHVEIETPAKSGKNEFLSKIQVEIYDSPKEALRSL